MLSKSKFYFFIGLIASCSVLFSCGDKDDETPNSPIVGTWNYSTYDFSGTINGQSIVMFLMEAFDISQPEAQALEAFFTASLMQGQDLEGTSIVFNADGTYVIRDNGAEVDSGTYNLQNNNSKLVLTSSEGVEEFDVKTLTNNQLVLSYTGEQQEDVTDDGELEDIAFTIDLTFVK